ncbi:hypothetical protein LNL84_19655, partial [Vibrio sp. ZSDZ34]
ALDEEGNLTVPAGVSAFDIILPTVDDEEVEATESYSLNVDGVPATGYILDNDKPSITSVDVTADDDTVVEGEDLVFNVQLSEATQSPVTYPITLPESLDVDVENISFSDGVTLDEEGNLNVPAGVSAFNITLPTVDDNEVEPTESYSLEVDEVPAT